MMAASLEPRPAKSGIMAALPQDNSMHDIAATTRLNERAIHRYVNPICRKQCIQGRRLVPAVAELSAPKG